MSDHTTALVVVAALLYLPVGWFAVGACNCVNQWMDKMSSLSDPATPMGKLAVVVWPLPVSCLLLFVLMVVVGFVVLGPFIWLMDRIEKIGEHKPPRRPKTRFGRWLAVGPQLCARDRRE